MERSGESASVRRGKKRAIDLNLNLKEKYSSSKKANKKNTTGVKLELGLNHQMDEKEAAVDWIASCEAFLTYYSGGTIARTPENVKTLANIDQRQRRKSPTPGSIRTIHDNTSRGYGWLLPGWLAEERLMEHGRVYRYYYDPSARLYHSQEEVIVAWDQAGLVVIDK